tara:strand:+ start:456 stop:827 length:372 start_codon:yes stop_codon:yes gene_type:complete
MSLEIGNGVIITFNNKNLLLLEKKLEKLKSKKLPYPKERPNYHDALPPYNPKWINSDNNNMFQNWKINEELKDIIRTQINNYNETVKIVKNSLEIYIENGRLEEENDRLGEEIEILNDELVDC